MKINHKAKVNIKREAFDEKFRKSPDALKNIGMPQSDILQNYPRRFCFSEQCFRLAENIWIISGLENLKIEHKFLTKNAENEIVRDPFADEQIIVIRSNDGYNIFTGCSHNGILHILDFVKKRFTTDKINLLAGGFHLNDRSPEEQNLFAEKIREYRISRIYTGHCSSDFATNRTVKVELFGSGTKIELKD